MSVHDVPTAWQNIFARAYAYDPKGTENDLMWILREIRNQPHYGTSHWFRAWTFDEILGRLKSGALSVEDDDVRNRG